MILLTLILLFKNILNKRHLIFKAALSTIVSTLAIALYFILLNREYHILSSINILYLIHILIEIILFNLSTVCLIYARTLSTKLMLLSMVTIVAGDMFYVYYYILSETISLYSIVGEFLWYLGVIFLLATTMLITQNSEFVFRSNTSIRSLVGFTIYVISMLSFLLINLIAYSFDLFHETLLFLFPLLGMLYLVIVVIISIFIGKKFEEPFKILQKNIQLILNNDLNAQIQHNFKIEEFSYLQDFLITVMDEKNKNHQLYLSFINASAQAAHDLGSPLLSVNNSIQNIQNNTLSQIDFSVMEASLLRIKEITSSLLSQYRKLTSFNSDNFNQSNALNSILLYKNHTENPKYINIIKSLNELINGKQLEWKLNPCKINLISQINFPMLFFTESTLIRMISNLLNNAYESLRPEIREIHIYIKSIGSQIAIEIEDSGIGIPPEKINDALNGVSSKHQGNGLGFLFVINYIKSLGGDFTLISDINKGTTVCLTFPYQQYPLWLPTNITHKSDTVFIILDDDPTIHIMLQLRCKDLKIQSYHFIKIPAFLNFVDNFSNKSKLLFLIDLNLNDQFWNGFKIIDKIHLLIHDANFYLLTSDADNLSVQTYVANKNIRLIPKEIINKIPMILDN